jgi:hypothetical protein
MSNPRNSSERAELLKLLDRLAAVDRVKAPGCMPDVLVDRWRHSDPEARRTIEEEIDRMPKRKKSS